MLSAAERGRLEDKLAERERGSGAQMFMAIFPSLEGDSVEDVAVRLEERWKVGRKGLSNGVLLVVFLKERKLRIEVGYGLEPVITDAVAASIIRDVIAPRFREQRYAAGLDAAVDAVFARIGGGPAPPPPRRPAPWSSADPATVLLFALFFGVFGVATFSALRSSRRAVTADGRGWSSHPHPGWARRAFTEADLDAIAAAVREAERGTSAEIRVHIERRVAHGLRRRTSDAMQRARDVFAALGMHRTAHRSGVLVYLAIEDRKLAIVGDEGIHTRVGDDYWTGVRDRMVERLRAGAVRGAVIGAVAEVGTTLARFFPRGPDDVDELPDDISLGR